MEGPETQNVAVPRKLTRGMIAFQIVALGALTAIQVWFVRNSSNLLTGVFLYAGLNLLFFVTVGRLRPEPRGPTFFLLLLVFLTLVNQVKEVLRDEPIRWVALWHRSVLTLGILGFLAALAWALWKDARDGRALK